MELFKHGKEVKMDVLKEVGNIGAGNAATALSRLLNKPIDMAVPKVQLLPFEQIAESVGGSEQLVIAVFLRVEGDAPSNLFFIMSLPDLCGRTIAYLRFNSQCSDGGCSITW